MLGVEPALLVALAGVSEMALFDPTPVTLADLASNFYATEADVAAGKSRAEACAAHLASLNPHVKINVLDGQGSGRSSSSDSSDSDMEAEAIMKRAVGSSAKWRGLSPTSTLVSGTGTRDSWSKEKSFSDESAREET